MPSDNVIRLVQPGAFADQLAVAKAQAGDRYTPKLWIKTPLNKQLSAFGRTAATTSRST